MRKAQRRTFALPTTGSIRAYYCRRLFNHRTSRLQTTQLAGVVYLECGLEMNPRNARRNVRWYRIRRTKVYPDKMPGTVVLKYRYSRLRSWLSLNSSGTTNAHKEALARPALPTYKLTGWEVVDGRSEGVGVSELVSGSCSCCSAIITARAHSMRRRLHGIVLATIHPTRPHDRHGVGFLPLWRNRKLT